MVTIILIGIPYLILAVVLEVIKSLYISINNVTDVSWYSIVLIAGTVILSAIIVAFFQKEKLYVLKW